MKDKVDANKDGVDTNKNELLDKRQSTVLKPKRDRNKWFTRTSIHDNSTLDYIRNNTLNNTCIKASYDSSNNAQNDTRKNTHNNSGNNTLDDTPYDTLNTIPKRYP